MTPRVSGEKISRSSTQAGNENSVINKTEQSHNEGNIITESDNILGRMNNLNYQVANQSVLKRHLQEEQWKCCIVNTTNETGKVFKTDYWKFEGNIFSFSNQDMQLQRSGVRR
jgi:hypothetical protein